jgi:gluconolactonase
MKCIAPSGLCLAMLCVVTVCGLPAVHAQDQLPETIGMIQRLDPEFDKLVPQGAKIEVLGGGYEWTEGPVWRPSGDVLFSDIPNNRINIYTPKSGVKVFMERSGYTGKEPFTGPEPGSNGLMLDEQGRLVMCCHGDRAVKRVETDGTLTVLADSYQGKRLNSPNDLIYHANGDLYFTDPPYGLPQRYEDPARELDWCGVYRLGKGGELTLLTKEMTRPNGIAFSPDQKTLHVAQSDPEAAIWKTFAVKPDGTLGEGKLFYDATGWVGDRPGLPDGMAVDVEGNIWATGPGGVLVFSPQGKLLGRLATGEKTANCTFGGDDGSTLYITADMYFCKVETLTQGDTWQKQHGDK